MAKYQDEVIGAMIKRFGYSNRHAVPTITKVVVSMGLGKVKDTPKRLEDSRVDLGTITGQRPVITKARKAVSNFKLREGDSIGLMVTLRKKMMYEFLDRLISVAIPRIKDFRGLSAKAFDGRGNFSMGLTEQVAFPEISLDKMEHVQGMNITFVTTAKTDDEARTFLGLFGMPYRKTG